MAVGTVTIGTIGIDAKYYTVIVERPTGREQKAVCIQGYPMEPQHCTFVDSKNYLGYSTTISWHEFMCLLHGQIIMLSDAAVYLKLPVMQ